jgi:protein TonB
MRFLVAVLLLAATAAAAAPGDLLKQVRDSSRASAQLNAEREQRFARERDAEAAHLREVQAQLRRNEARAAGARRRWDSAHKTTAELEKKLAAVTRELDTLYDAARGAAVDLHDTAQTSLVTAQFPERMAELAPLAASATRPAAAELEQIWKALQFDVEQSGKSAAFTASVVTDEGSAPREVLRVGVFAAAAGGEYFALYPGGKELLEMDRQPPWRLRRLARKFENSTADTAPMLLDPSRGALLIAEANRPGLFERLWHSGVGGYFIAGILILAMGLAIIQPLWLRSRLIIDEQSIGVVVGTLAAFALVQWWVWVPGEPAAQEEQIATVDLVSEEEETPEEEPPPPELVPPPPPPPVATPESGMAGLPAMAAPTVAPLLSNIQIPVKIAGGGSLTGAGFGGFARGTGTGAGTYGRGQGFKGKPLIPLSTARPQMPEWACKQQIKGWVEAVFTVLPNGRVQDVKIVDAQPRGVYEIAAIESISNWIYAETDRAREVKQRVPMDPADCAFNWR